MHKGSDVGDLIASREMYFVYDDGTKESAAIKIGKPYIYSKDNDWCCPYEISMGSNSKIFGMIGIDSLQSLQLTLKTLSTEVAYWERKYNGKFYYLDEYGACV
nr:hypothetical protein 3 [Gammaproteobacteria bacterium]